ncbi:hypothetical protein ACIQUD_00585 [Streptomyces globisporus]|uniref:hypothetical protein n=1 Tax=Streptomyces globisporus TaxID=1908 RepID=UPI00382ABE89
MVDEEGSPRRKLRKGPVAKATIAELADLGIDPAVNTSAAAAVRLATELDSAKDVKGAATAARELRQAMATARGMAAPRERGGPVDQLAARAAQRAAARRAG